VATARAAGAMMLFGEKYPDPVRMVSMGQFSRELCGGTHLDNTRDVGGLEIISEEGVAAGTRRITALTGDKAQQHIDAPAPRSSRCQRTRRGSPGGSRRRAATDADQPGFAQAVGGGVPAAKPAASPQHAPANSPGMPAYSQVRAALRDAARVLMSRLRCAAAGNGTPGRSATAQSQIANRKQSGQLSAEALLEKSQVVGKRG